jgi:glycosyltransferase involved in cell wall biosynthesis
MSVMFVGAFNPIASDMSDSSSGAGAKVQYEIINSILVDNPDLETMVMQEFRTWPYGSFYIRGKKIGPLNFLPMVNLFFTKKMFFAIQVFMTLLFNNPDKIYFYNTNSYLNVLMFFLGFLRRKQAKVLIIQDLNVPRDLSFGDVKRFDRVLSYFFAKLTKYSFNYFVPITRQLGAYLGLPQNRCLPFIGGFTGTFTSEDCSSVSHRAVFAGALEKYNGIDYLLEAWSRLESTKELHIFGNGSLAGLVKDFAQRSSNIVYHGFQPPPVVNEYISCASINICLRYSRGIEEEFFFPSKFFDVLMHRGVVVCNDFKNIPYEFREYICFIDERFSNLESIIDKSSSINSFYEQRVKLVSEKFSWLSLIRDLERKFGIKK